MHIVPNAVSEVVEHATRRASTLVFPFPNGEEKTVDDAGFPDIDVAGRCELAGITSVDAHIVRQVIVQSKVGALRIHSRQKVVGIGPVAKRLLHPEDRFQPAQQALSSTKM